MSESNVALVALVALFGILAVCFMVFCITILILFGGIFIFYYGKSDIKNKFPDCNYESFEKIYPIVFNLFCFKSKPNEETPIKKTEEVPIKKSEEVPIKKSDEVPIKKSEEILIKKTEETPIKKSEEVPVKKSEEIQNNENQKIQNNEKLVNNLWNSINSCRKNTYVPIPEPEYYVDYSEKENVKKENIKFGNLSDGEKEFFIYLFSSLHIPTYESISLAKYSWFDRKNVLNLLEESIGKLEIFSGQFEFALLKFSDKEHNSLTKDFLGLNNDDTDFICYVLNKYEKGKVFSFNNYPNANKEKVRDYLEKIIGNGTLSDDNIHF